MGAKPLTPQVLPGALGTPERFYQRFRDGQVLDPSWPRLTTEESLKGFPPRPKGLKILFINAPIREWSYPNIMPLGHGYVASVAVMDGHSVRALDLNAERRKPIRESPEAISRWVEERVAATLAQEKPDVIGLGGIVTQYHRIKQIAKLCKRIYPDVPVVLGGGIASSLPIFMLKRMGIDAVVQEEGEVTFSELLHRWEEGASLEGLKGVAYRRPIRSGEWDCRDNGLRPSLKSRAAGLGALPWPLRGPWPIDDIYKVNPVGHLNWTTKWIDGAPLESGQYSESMIASRGCPYAAVACDYCYAAYLGKQYRLRSPQDVVDEMVFLKERYHLTYIHFLDDLMMTDYRWALEFCDELKERRRKTGFEITWGGTCRTNIIADDILRARKEGRPHMLEQAHEAGMRQAGYGVESASPAVLKAIDKSGQTVEKMELAIRETQRIMGYADCSFMIGSPGETRQTMQETVDFCRRVGLRPEVFFFTTAYPATTFWQLALDRGLIAKAVTGKRGPANEDLIEEYLIRLGEQGESVRTNFSDLPDEEVVELSWWAIRELGAQNTVRHPHTGEEQELVKPAVRGASRADL
jgi:radical SAM superfamily enzyme YgiQ (UPF0313 family)